MLNVNDYIVGKQLDEMLAAGEDLEIVWPFKDGFVSDWTAAEALWYASFDCFASVRRTLQETCPLRRPWDQAYAE